MPRDVCACCGRLRSRRLHARSKVFPAGEGCVPIHFLFSRLLGARLRKPRLVDEGGIANLFSFAATSMYFNLSRLTRAQVNGMNDIRHPEARRTAFRGAEGCICAPVRLESLTYLKPILPVLRTRRFFRSASNHCRKCRPCGTRTGRATVVETFRPAGENGFDRVFLSAHQNS